MTEQEHFVEKPPVPFPDLPGPRASAPGTCPQTAESAGLSLVLGPLSFLLSGKAWVEGIRLHIRKTNIALPPLPPSPRGGLGQRASEVQTVLPWGWGARSPASGVSSFLCGGASGGQREGFPCVCAGGSFRSGVAGL